MGENNTLIFIGIIMLMLLSSGITYLIAKNQNIDLTT